MRIVAHRNPARLAAEARAELAATDWQVIRAMERLLARQGDLAPEFVARREAARDAAGKDR